MRVMRKRALRQALERLGAALAAGRVSPPVVEPAGAMEVPATQGGSPPASEPAGAMEVPAAEGGSAPASEDAGATEVPAAEGAAKAEL